jgi:hypothetical protein
VKPRAPYLDEVLANVRPGRHVRLYLTDHQKHATSDRDGLILRRVVRALLQARHDASNPKQPPRSFPLTAPALQAVARKLGCDNVGDKRAYALIRRAKECGLLQDAGRYKARRRLTGDRRVPVYTLGARITGLRSAHRQPTVGRRRHVKPARPSRWWGHLLFGGAPDPRPPPHEERARAAWMRRYARMRSLDELGQGFRWSLRSDGGPCGEPNP